MVNRLHDRLPDDLYRAATQQSPNWMWIFDLSGNPIGVSPEQNAGSNLYETVYENDLAQIKKACRQLLDHQQPFDIQFRTLLPNGTTIWLEGKGYPFNLSEEKKGAAITASNITYFKENEEKLTRLAYYDSLTGLPNRRLFLDRFSQSLNTAKRYRYKIAVIYLDLDDFKRINDTYGHHTGDEFLITASSRISHSVREPDTVCRMGGDEFVILLQQFEQKEDVLKIAKRISEALSQPFELNKQKITNSCSVGISFFPEDGQDCETLLRYADAAMYGSKQKGKNQIQFFNENK